MNLVVLQGRLASDPEGGESGQGVSYAKFSVAMERKVGNDKVVQYLDVVTFRQQADFVRQYLNKGDAINVTGSLNIRDWVDTNGQKRKSYEVVATQVGFPVSGRSRGNNASYGNRQQAPRNGGTPAAVGAPDPYDGY